MGYSQCDLVRNPTLLVVMTVILSLRAEIPVFQGFGEDHRKPLIQWEVPIFQEFFKELCKHKGAEDVNNSS